MAIEPRRQLIVLGVLLVALAGVLVYNLNGSEPAAPPSTASNTQRPTARGRQGPLSTAQELDIRLDALKADKPAPEDSERNPFRFRPAPPPPPPPAPTGPPPPDPERVVVPAGPPPIPMKFIGIIESPTAGKVAALKDERGVYHGREGEIIEGRYRIVQIRVESIVMEYADGRGRQTIRLSGQ